MGDAFSTLTSLLDWHKLSTRNDEEVTDKLLSKIKKNSIYFVKYFKERIYWKFSRKCRNGLFCFDQWPIETSFAPQFCYKLYPSLTVHQWNVQHVRIGTTLFQIIAKNLYWFDRILVLQTDFSEYFLTKLTGKPIHWILLVFVMGSLTESLFMYLFANATLIVIYELKLFHLWLASKPKQNIFNIKWGKFI